MSASFFAPTAFEGRRVVITGGGSGIGRATAQLFAAHGARVALLDASSAQEAAGDIGAGTSGFTVDVRDRAGLDDAMARVAAELGGIDTLVCAAGVLRAGRLADFPASEWDTVMDVNVKGVFQTCQAALPYLMRTGETSDPGQRTRIVAVSSASAMQPKVGLGAYAMSKAALVTFVRVLSAELADRGVNVNAVAPGTIRTPMVLSRLAGEGSGDFKLYGAAPVGRLGEPEDVAQAIAFLCSPAADFITGTVLGIDGGTTATFPA